MRTLNYEYGIKPPINPEVVQEQLWLRHRYRNKLIEIERDRRQRYRKIMEKHQLPIQDKLYAWQEMRDLLKTKVDALKATRAATRSRSDTKEQRDEIKVIRARKKVLAAELKEAREALKQDAATQAALKALATDTNVAVKAARVNRGLLYWGSSCAEEAAQERSSNDLGIWDRQGNPHDPKFLRWQGGTALNVQIQKAHQVPFEELLECTHSQLQFEMEPRLDAAVVGKSKAKRRRGTMRIRAGSVIKEGKTTQAPIWAAFPILLHRDPPAGSVVTQVQVNRRTISDSVRWTVVLTLAIDCDHTESCGHGVVALDIGWRNMHDLRVAYTLDEHGEEAAYLMDSDIRDRLTKVRELQQTRDKAQNAMRDSLLPWLKKQKTQMPEELREKTRYIHNWKSPAAFVRLLDQWRENHWHGDERGFYILETWAIGVWSDSLNRRDGGDKHLWRWMEHVRTRTLRSRNDSYRKYAAQLARRYGVLVLEDFVLSDTQENPKPESTKVKIQGAAAQQREAAPSELRNALVGAFLSRGGQVFYVDPAMTTQRCHLCGYAEPWDAAKSIKHECEGCHATWDQDANAARNILELYLQGNIKRTAKPYATTEEGGAWKKRKDKSKEKNKDKKPN